MPEPASNRSVCLPQRISMQLVLPPWRENSGPDTGMLPRTPQNLTRKTSPSMVAPSQFPSLIVAKQLPLEQIQEKCEPLSARNFGGQTGFPSDPFSKRPAL